MRGRLVMILLVPVLLSCSKTYTYQSHEVIRSFDQVVSGEDIKVVKRDGELLQGRSSRSTGM